LASTNLPRMPHELLAETHLHLYRGLIQKCPIFDVNKLQVKAVLNLLYKLEPMIGVPGQQLLRQGIPNYTLFIIERGTVHVWKDFENKEKRLKMRMLKHANFFGERSILAAWEKGETSDVATATCVCHSYCDLLTLSLEQFVRTLERSGSSMNEFQKLCKSSAGRRDRRGSVGGGRRNSWIDPGER